MRYPISLAALALSLVASAGLSGCVLPFGVAPCEPNPAHDLLSEINRVRALEGVPPVRPNTLLARAAQAHANFLAAEEGEGHLGSGGSTPLDRIIEAGYPPEAFGENIVWGSFSPEQAVQAWMDSPGHRTILLEPTYDEVGLGSVLDPRQPIWVANFGAQREQAIGRCHPWPIR